MDDAMKQAMNRTRWPQVAWSFTPLKKASISLKKGIHPSKCMLHVRCHRPITVGGWIRKM